MSESVFGLEAVLGSHIPGTLRPCLKRDDCILHSELMPTKPLLSLGKRYSLLIPFSIYLFKQPLHTNMGAAMKAHWLAARFEAEQLILKIGFYHWSGSEAYDGPTS